MCCEGKEIDFKELQSPEKEAFMKNLFGFLGGGFSAGPSMPDPSMPINAPNDPNMAAGMNMFREMGGLPTNYTPYQAPQFWNPQWNPQWPSFPNYYGGGTYGSGGGNTGGGRTSSPEGEGGLPKDKRTEHKPIEK